MVDRVDREFFSRYLCAMEAGDAAVVSALSVPGALLEYPGGKQFDSPGDLFAWSQGRHGWVRHIFEHTDYSGEGLEYVVFVSGTLEGAWNDGTAFEGIRFIYRFKMVRGLVAETRLWSDVADRLRTGGG